MNPQLNLNELKQRVEREIEGYAYDVHEGAIGRPWPPEKVERELRAFRNSLVEPYWVQVTDDDKTQKPCVVVADDRVNNLLVFEPLTQRFMLVTTSKPGGNLISFGVDGDAVGCFFAR